MKSRRFRFSLRTMLVLTAALCVWLGIQVNAARRQREAVAVLLNARAIILYDYQVVPHQAGVDRLPPGPAWLRELIGDDYSRTVVAVIIRPEATIQKSVLDELAKLPYVREFGLMGDLWRTEISDNDLAALREFHQLEWLNLVDVHLSGSILATLSYPGRLKILRLNGTDADDAALKYCEKMMLLEILDLGGTRVTDVGLVHLRNIKNLDDLRLNDTRITDAGLEHLHGLKKLTYLHLQRTRVSEAGVSALRAALPNANIMWP